MNRRDEIFVRVIRRINPLSTEDLTDEKILKLGVKTIWDLAWQEAANEFANREFKENIKKLEDRHVVCCGVDFCNVCGKPMKGEP